MACPCCGPVWRCASCCCPDGSTPPASVVLRLEKVNQDNSGINAAGTYTLKQDIFGFAGVVDRVGAVSVVSRARNCVNYTLTGNSHQISATKWPNYPGTVCYFRFTGVEGGVSWTLSAILSGGNNHDLCSGPTGEGLGTFFVMQVSTSGGSLPNGPGSQFYNVYISN